MLDALLQQPQSYGHALVYTLVIASEILTIVGNGNKVRSWLGFFEILWPNNDTEPSPDELAKWQYLVGRILQLEDHNVKDFMVSSS